MDLIRLGLGRTLRGLRTGNANLVLLGSALLFAGWLRRSTGGRTLVYRQRLREGQAVTVRFVAPGTPRLRSD